MYTAPISLSLSLSLSLVALVAGVLALACSVVLYVRLWREGRKHAHDTERELDAVFEHALDAIAILDNQGVCVDANPAAFAILVIAQMFRAHRAFLRTFLRGPARI